ncbi:MAG: DNA polymerase/3'-5' exonuclease PolX [Euryarchaeota archaeon]|nr:DNA polymerase/3'-5' exonuclease PolX [Euryarchaeota archaeon]
MSRNVEVAALLYQIAKILEIQGVPFKPRAYQRAALNVESLAEDIERVVAEDRLEEIPGVGEAIALKIKEYLTSGKLAYLEKLKKEVPEGLLALMAVPGLGPKKAQRLWKELKIHSLDELKAALAAHKVRDHPGFGEKSEADLLKAVGNVAQSQLRHSLFEARQHADTLAAHLRKDAGKSTMVFAGSYRRGRDTVGDLDLLVEASTKDAPKVIDAFTRYPLVDDVLEKGTTRSRVRLKPHLQVDLRVVPAESFGAAMLYFTGSKEHNIALRSLALRKGYTLNEYALSRKKDGRRLAGATEDEVYGNLGLKWIPPEIRENRGEIELAAKGHLPKLLEPSDIRGDLHTHTNESDGAVDLETMLNAAAKKGYAYYGVSDHSAGLRITQGLDATRYRRQRRAIEKLQDSFPKLRILQGSEMEILRDGRLDLDAEARRGLDYIVGAVHSAFGLGKREQTARVLKAMDSGIDILAHPTCRRVGKRPAIELDLEAVADKAKETGVLLEIDATPDRFDLWGEVVQVCRERGARFAVDSDAHSVPELDYVPFGVTQARRGWLTARHVANTQPLKALLRDLGHAKRA